ncbi:MAG: IS1634 family transposase [Bacilli bacterium]
MFVKQNKSWKGTLLTYTVGYRKNGKVKHKNIETIGYLEDLKKEYDDPIAHFKALAKEKTNAEINEYTIKNIRSKKIDTNSKNKNFGYCILKQIYNELGIKEIFEPTQRVSNIEYDLNDIFSMLVYMRVIKPNSKKNSFENKDILFEKNDFSLDDIYRSLTIFNPLKEQIQKAIWLNTKDKYKRDTSTTYYDCTNYYFEIEYSDEDIYKYDAEGNVVLDENGLPIILEKGLRKDGPEKNNRKDPIVEMGLLMDASGIPMAYDVFYGNESEKNSLIPIINRSKKDFGFERTIVVADRGLNTSDNIIQLAGTSLEQSLKMNGYVYGQSIRGADKEFKKWVLESNYISEVIQDDNGKEVHFVHKSRIYPKKMYVIREDKGKTKKGNKIRESIIVDQKQMVYFSQKYADKQRRDREKVIKKANDLINNPGKYTKTSSYGVVGYINNLSFIKDTGEVANANELSINQKKIDEDSKFDGYYSIVTSEENLSDIEIRNIYRGLAKIEETFKVTKSGLSSRPVWVSRNDHIQSHFLLCFVSLVIIRLLENILENKHSAFKIIETIRNFTSTNLEHDIYINNFRNNVIEDIEKKLDIDLSKKILTLSEINKFFK